MASFFAKFIGAGVAATLLTGAAHAQFTNLPPGSVQSPIPQVAGAAAGTLLDTEVSPWTGTNAGLTIAGTIVSSVYDNGSFLDFYYQLTVTQADTPVNSYSITSFADLAVQVAEDASDIDGAGTNFSSGVVPAFQVSRDPGSGAGLTLSYVPGPGLNAGDISIAFAARVVAPGFTRNGGAGILASGVSANAAVIAPLALGVLATPEPVPLSLLALGLLAAGCPLGAVARARRAQSKGR